MGGIIIIIGIGIGIIGIGVDAVVVVERTKERGVVRGAERKSVRLC